jgi:phage terminase large subunit-like protein
VTTPATFAAKILQARTDPNAFISFALGGERGEGIVQSAVHQELQNHLSSNRHALIELPRDHGKTTQTVGRLLWELGRRPELRVKLVCATTKLAEERGDYLLRGIKRRRVRLVFPRLLPGKPWNSVRLTIQRPGGILGPTVSCLGVRSGSTGSRADLLILDDVVDVASFASKTIRESVKASFRDNLMNLVEPDGRVWSLFTPWHRNDLNAELKKTPGFALFRRAIADDLLPIWPERWTRDALETRRNEIGSAAFARGFRLIPVSEDDTLIKPEWVNVTPSPTKITRTILSIDPAVTPELQADASAIVVMHQHDGRGIHASQAKPHRVKSPRLVELIAEADRIHKPEVILFEANAAFRGIADLLIHHASFGPKIKPIRAYQDKASRVASLAVLCENGTFTLGRGNPELEEEMISFPVGDSDDLVDATSMGANYLLSQKEPRIWL